MAKFNILDLLLPRETKFYTLLEKQSANLLEIARCFRELVGSLGVADSDVILKKLVKIKELEKAGDKIERQVIDELDTTFITPLDREDIHLLAMSMDQAVDLIHGLARKLELYNIREIPAPLKSFCDIIVGISDELVKLMQALPTKKGVQEIIRIIHELEKRGDDTFSQSVAQLFSENNDAVYIIKFKEIYELSEEIIDSVDYVGKTIRGIMVKLG
jgi:uncharacterized protein Yka (UPF0111/DUF47 family)